MVQMRQPYERPALKQDAKAAMAKKSPTIYLLSLLMLVINLLPTAVIQGRSTSMPSAREAWTACRSLWSSVCRPPAPASRW